MANADHQAERSTSASLLQSMSLTLRSLQPDDESSPSPIPRVPSLRRHSYEPRMFPIGPYHRASANPPRFHPSSPYKWRFLRHLLRRTPDHSASLSSYVASIRPLEPQIRITYSESIDLDADALTELMILDGCFLIELLIKWSAAEPDPLFAPSWVLPILRTDLLMLENQIPFLVLRRLFDASCLAPLSLTVLVANYLSSGCSASVLPRIPLHGTIHHLLHLFHLCTVPPVNSRPVKTNHGLAIRSDKRSPRALPSATELSNAGVRFRRKITGANDDNFLDVTFHGGTMEIPRLSIEYLTKCRFQNLVAFEQCTPGAGNALTSYLMLMDCLVNSVNDVLLLQRRGIIESKLGCDDSAVEFFGEVCDCAFLDYEDHYLVGLFADVATYCEVRQHRWRAALARDYFGSPWSVASLLAAVLLLFLAIVQALFAVASYIWPRGGGGD